MKNIVNFVGFDLTSWPLVIARHAGYLDDAGQLVHLTDGTVRATVPPEAIEAYCENYPQLAKCAGVTLVSLPGPVMQFGAASAALVPADAPEPVIEGAANPAL